MFVSDEMTLQIPELDLKPGLEVLCSDPEIVEKLEQCVMNWQTHITIVIEEQQHKKPQVRLFLCSTLTPRADLILVKCLDMDKRPKYWLYQTSN